MPDLTGKVLGVCEQVLILTSKHPHHLHPMDTWNQEPFRNIPCTSFPTLQKHLPYSTRSMYSLGLGPPVQPCQPSTSHTAHKLGEDAAQHQLAPLGFHGPPGDFAATPATGSTSHGQPACHYTDASPCPSVQWVYPGLSPKAQGVTEPLGAGRGVRRRMHIGTGA